jgi:hypothetical protein
MVVEMVRQGRLTVAVPKSSVPALACRVTLLPVYSSGRDARPFQKRIRIAAWLHLLGDVLPARVASTDGKLAW